jgi:hypothetical protein
VYIIAVIRALSSEDLRKEPADTSVSCQENCIVNYLDFHNIFTIMDLYNFTRRSGFVKSNGVIYWLPEAVIVRILR